MCAKRILFFSRNYPPRPGLICRRKQTYRRSACRGLAPGNDIMSVTFDYKSIKMSEKVLTILINNNVRITYLNFTNSRGYDALEEPACHLAETSRMPKLLPVNGKSLIWKKTSDVMGAGNISRLPGMARNTFVRIIICFCIQCVM